jgi:hypothetical protein
MQAKAKLLDINNVLSHYLIQQQIDVNNVFFFEIQIRYKTRSQPSGSAFFLIFWVKFNHTLMILFFSKNEKKNWKLFSIFIV